MHWLVFGAASGHSQLPDTMSSTTELVPCRSGDLEGRRIARFNLRRLDIGT